MAGFVKVAKTVEISPGHGKLVEAGGKKIALFNVEDLGRQIRNL